PDRPRRNRPRRGPLHLGFASTKLKTEEGGLTMSAPWVEDVNTFGAYVGGFLGGGLGGLCGIWGAIAGTLAPKGKAKSFVLGMGLTLIAIGVILLGIGLYALLDSQPYGIWYP